MTDLVAHAESADAVIAALGTRAEGLDAAEVGARQARFGPNELPHGTGTSAWRLLLEQLSNVLILVLLVAIAISAFLGHTVEAIAIGVIVAFAVVLGFVQEYRAERALEALQRLAAPKATVIRDGQEQPIAARELVPGDVVLLTPGDLVPADARLIDMANLQVDEAPLTGESLAVPKDMHLIAAPAAAVGDRKNMVYSGTSVTYGRGRAVVVATGPATEFGRIATLLRTIEQARTPLQVNLDRVGQQLVRAAAVVVVLIVAAGIARGQPILEMLVFGIALAVAVVPEALPAVVTISLALGVQRMVRRNVLVRRLPAVETLGSTTVICSDKTGTLTRDEMTVRRMVLDGRLLELSGVGYAPTGELTGEPQVVALGRELLKAAVLSSDATVSPPSGGEPWTVRGDPTEGALIVAARKAGLDPVALARSHPRVDEIPFTSETKRMTTVHRSPDGPIAFAKGAPEVLIGACSHVRTLAGTVPLDDERKAQVMVAAAELAASALRVLAIAEKPGATKADAEQGLVLLGLVGMLDPPRAEAADAVRRSREAGVEVVMITGDHPVTARAVAQELGLARHERVLTGAEIERLDDDALLREVEHVGVYARVSPEHKLRVVGALQRRGHVVAMTGDGVNDAPALKQADIGIAMGIGGTDVSREAAAMTLTDDNFASIVAAVEEGRGIYDNIKKYLMYLLSSNIGEIGLMIGAAVLGLPLPLTAVQILYVNLATDGLPALALSVDPPSSDLMARKPRDPKVGLFTRPVVTLMVLGGAWSTFVNLSLFLWARSVGKSDAEAVTMTFVSLVLIQFVKAYNFRSDRQSVFVRPFANRWLNLAIVWELALLIGIVHLPFLHGPFGTFSLTVEDWVIVSGLAFTVLPVLEVAKGLGRRGWFGRLD